MRRLRRAAVFFTALVVVSLPGIAQSADTITGEVTAIGGGAIQGAVVTVAGPGQRPVTATTAADGKFSIAAGGNPPYSLSVQAAGFAGQSFAEPPDEPIALDTAKFTPLPLHAGSAREVAADPTSGIFYALMNQAPELYRSLDHGGTWQSVPMGYEDADTGLIRAPFGNHVVTTSGVSGEVAVTTQGRAGETFGGQVRYSTDYGVTWQTVGGSPLPQVAQATRLRFLFWGHAAAGAPSVLVVAQRQADNSWSVWRADMTAASPTFTAETADPFGTGAVVAGAHAGDGAFLGRVTAAGELGFARLTATGPIAFGPPEVTGLPAPPDLLRLGGAKEPSEPPDGAVVVGGSPYAVRFLTKAAGAATFAGASSAAAPAAAACHYGENIFHEGTGSVAPTSSGTSGAGHITGCWVTKTGSALTFHEGFWAFSAAYDARWGIDNEVLLRGGVDGAVKSARSDSNGVPEYSTSIASPGTAATSGGISITGIVSPVVTDTAYGPSASQLSVAISNNGGSMTLASRDGGQTYAHIHNRGFGSTATEWWNGASGEWLAFGTVWTAPGGNLLSAALNWDGSTSLGMPNVQGSRREDLSAPTTPPNYGIASLEVVPGTDTAFIGLGFAFDPQLVGDNALYRARLVPGNPPSLVDRVPLHASFGAVPFFLPQALRYCPASAQDERMRDVLFVATGDVSVVGPTIDQRGSLLRITGATTGSPAVTEIASIPHGAQNTMLTDVRADCATGTVYAGGITGASTLYKSTDGGVNFTAITLTGPGGIELGGVGVITAIGLNPADPNDVKVAAGPGFITHSSDGGVTWTTVNDPAVHRPMPVNDIEFAPGGGGLAATSSGLALLGTGAGAFRANLSATSGVIGVTPAARGTGLAREQITSLASDSHPAAVVAPNGASTAVFRRSNGLYHASTAVRAGWSLPTLIPRTAGGALPVAALDPAGRLHVAYARRGTSPGIYAVTRAANGVWASPRRVSNGAGDTLPAIAVTGRNSVQVVFLRGRGAKGMYHVSSRAGRWGKARRLRGTGAADAKAALGGPSVAVRLGRLHLTFARAGRAPGIVYMLGRGSAWSAPLRLTKTQGTQPTIAVGATGLRHIVFRRRGLFSLRGTKRWSLARIPRTVAADTEPALSASGAGFTLVFARPKGNAPGIYMSRTAAISGRWPARPRRVSSSAKDRNPAFRADRFGRETTVFERG